MRRSVRIAVGVAAVAVGVILLASALADLDEEARTETFQGVTELVLDLKNSPVDIRGGGSDTVIEISTTTGFFGGDVVVEQNGGTVLLEQKCPLIIGWGCRASVEVSLPSQTAISGSTSNGAITVASLDAPINVTTSNGAISLDDISATTVLRTSNGAITGTGLTSDQVEATTSNGRVGLAFATAPSLVQVRTSNGMIEVLLPSDAPPYAVDTSTSNGTVSTDVRTDPAASDSIVARTSNGDITIRYGD